MPPTTRGILVIPNPQRDIRLAHLDSRAYILVVGTYTKGMHARGIFLISSPGIREIIANHRFEDGHPVGSTSIEFSPQFKMAFLNNYEPLTKERAFKKIGAADHLDLLLEKHFAKVFPAYKLSLTQEPERARINQWIKRGRQPREAYPLYEAWRQTRKRVIENHRKNRLRRNA